MRQTNWPCATAEASNGDNTTHWILSTLTQRCRKEVRNHTKRKPDTSLVWTDTSTLFRRNAIFNLNWLPLPQMDPDLNWKYRPTLEIGHFFIRILLWRSLQNHHKKTRRWPVYPSTNDRGSWNTPPLRLTFSRSRRTEERRAKHPCSRPLQWWENTASSDRTIVTRCSSHGKWSRAQTQTWQTLLNCNTSRGSSQ